MGAAVVVVVVDLACIGPAAIVLGQVQRAAQKYNRENAQYKTHKRWPSSSLRDRTRGLERFLVSHIVSCWRSSWHSCLLLAFVVDTSSFALRRSLRSLFSSTTRLPFRVWFTGRSEPLSVRNTSRFAVGDGWRRRWRRRRLRLCSVRFSLLRFVCFRFRFRFLTSVVKRP
jgi:hypothetical protein